MHQRNPYKTPPDFESLARAYPPLRPHIIRASDNGHSTIDFYDEASLRRLTQALLCRDFNIQLEIPNDRLCPPVPNRLNYILWLQDIISHTTSPDLPAPVRGIDIGTGASAIYPLVACRLSPHWNFVATGQRNSVLVFSLFISMVEIDTASLLSAQSNIDRNGLSERITLIRADPTGSIMSPLVQDAAASFDFCMCNPPFYASKEEATHSSATKALLPSAICTGADVEMITPGGEEAFVGRMVNESITLGERCRWYTSMLGKQSSLTALVTLLRAHSITNYALTELVQGHTRRWALAWSFTDTRVPDDVARPSASALRRLLPPRTSYRQQLHSAPPVGTLQRMLSALADDAVSISDKPRDKICVVARRDTWSRSARRRVRGLDSDPAAGRTGTREEETRQQVLLVADVWMEGGVELVVEWKRGHDVQAFESFASHIGRKIG
ncbi:hypothetical protein BJV78DRAFT_1347967 [Lactifluus subvellereus]|nr:hypothetical protein BJV78DRAFT_1347967 [Lactifluus subvellereus]